MASEKVTAIVDDARKAAVETILDMMENKGLQWVCEWDSSAFIPHNGATDRKYHGGNRLHLMARAYRMGYEDSRWFTFKQAVEMGYGPKKGEKAAIVEYWKTMNGMKDADGEITFDPNEAVERFTYPKLVGYFRVFNAEQLVDKDGNPMPPLPEREREKPLDEELIELADGLIASSRYEVKESKAITQASYSPLFDVVRMPSRTVFRDMESFITTLTHEMSHSTMKPLGRVEASGNYFGSEGYAFEELIAELGSTFACLDLGVHRASELESDENFENHAAYLQSWMKKFKDDPDSLFRAVSSAEKAADYIIDGYTKYLASSREAVNLEMFLTPAIERADLHLPGAKDFQTMECDELSDGIRCSWTSGESFVNVLSFDANNWCIESNINGYAHVAYGETLGEAYFDYLRQNIGEASFTIKSKSMNVLIGNDGDFSEFEIGVGESLKELPMSVKVREVMKLEKTFEEKRKSLYAEKNETQNVGVASVKTQSIVKPTAPVH